MGGNLLFGLELECGIINDVVSKHIGSYHQGEYFGAGDWVAEHDGSLHFSNAIPVEFVSPVFTSDELEPTLTLLMDRLGGSLTDMNGIAINKSCGAHIHFSFQTSTQRCNSMYKKIPRLSLEWIRNTSWQRVEKKLPHVFSKFRSHYFRDYAQKKGDIHEMTDKYSEFHFTSHQGVEWRSFNLNGVKTWADIFKMYEIGCSTVEEGIDRIYEYDEITVTDNDVKEYLNAMVG